MKWCRMCKKRAIIFVRLCIMAAQNAAPNLVEPGIRRYMLNALQECHSNRVLIYFWILNAGVVVLIAIIVGLFVYYSWTRRLTPVEYRNKLIRDHEEVLKQIRIYREERDKINGITGLPLRRRGEEETPLRQIFFSNGK